ncbi:MAG: hypothetical protein L0Z62_18180, partial [Gemmataceae bacterium]|nr:hypothetical protein [Gemmataceae bacterium]
MEFDTADLATLEASGQLYDVVLHEMGHLFGIGTIWQALGLLTGAGTTNPRFLGARATAEYNALFGTSATSVPVEGRPSPVGSRDGHWRESVFGNELLTPYISGSSNPLSRVTVAALADLGYTVNLSAADTYAPPRSIVGSGGTSGSGGGGDRASLVLDGTQASVDAVALLSRDRLSNVRGSQHTLATSPVGQNGPGGEVETLRHISANRSERGFFHGSARQVVAGLRAALGEWVEPFGEPADFLQTRTERPPGEESAGPARTPQTVGLVLPENAHREKVPETESLRSGEGSRTRSWLPRPEFGAMIFLLLRVFQRRALDWQQSATNRPSGGLASKFHLYGYRQTMGE